jgi:hypothetical protein
VQCYKPHYVRNLKLFSLNSEQSALTVNEMSRHVSFNDGPQHYIKSSYKATAAKQVHNMGRAT